MPPDILPSPLNATWYSATFLPAPMWGARGAFLGDRFLIVGGYAGGYQDSIFAWEPVSQVFLFACFFFCFLPASISFKPFTLNCGFQVWEVAGNLMDGRYYHAVATISQHSLDNICP